ncbi:MAG: hypothetical protein O3A51_11915, partial [Verrucomicrobia bacterium]|nr:hypothetical protein [Verrucomicrobiota bacterium]
MRTSRASTDTATGQRFRFWTSLASLAAIIALPGTASAAQVGSPVCWIGFTNASGSVATDSSGFGNDATLGASASLVAQGGPTLGSGEILDALDIDGSQTFAAEAFRVPAAAEISTGAITTNGSVVLWVRPTLAVGTSRIGFLRNSGLEAAPAGGVYFEKISSGGGQFYASPSPGTQAGASGMLYVQNTWLHVAMTWDVNAGQSRIYTNGALRVANLGGAPTTAGNSFGDWIFGSSSLHFPINNPWAYQGKIADFAIYRDALKQYEINDIYDGGVIGYGIVGDPKCWIEFTNAAGSVATDSSGYGNDATLGASASFSAGGGPALTSGLVLDALD